MMATIPVGMIMERMEEIPNQVVTLVVA